jgi:hypothetical protein
LVGDRKYTHPIPKLMLKDLGDLLKLCWNHEPDKRPNFATLHDSISDFMKSARSDMKFPQQMTSDELEEEQNIIFELTNVATNAFMSVGTAKVVKLERKSQILPKENTNTETNTYDFTSDGKNSNKRESQNGNEYTLTADKDNKTNTPSHSLSSSDTPTHSEPNSDGYILHSLRKSHTKESDYSLTPSAERPRTGEDEK